ncbi:MAG: hypothetical protein SOY36_02565 [Oscillospiraceae bacterium]|nr:hypothetical protein [Oscillospiraceae bacterium]
MKKSALTTTISILLIVACLFALAAAGFGVKDGLAIKQYKEDDAKAADVVGDLEKAIQSLKENEAAYNEGVGTYAKGLSDYAAGQQAYNEGQATLAQGYKDYDEGKATLEQGYKDYEAGKKALEEGRQKIAEGQKMIDENTDAYNEGKALLSKIEPLMPLLNTYVKFRDGSIAKLPGFDSAQAWFAGKVAPLAERMGLTIPADVTDFPAYVQNMVAEGQAMLKQYEDGLAELEAGKAELAAGEKQLAEAEKQLAQGEKDLAEGKKALENGEKELAAGAQELAEGAAQLAAGKNDLEAFEAGMALVDEYTMVCYKNEPIYRHNGEMAVPGPEQRLGADFDWKKYDENGNLVTLRNGEPYLDLDQCLVVCKSFRESVDHHVADVTNELYMRLGLYVALSVTAILGIIGGILGLVGKRGAFVLGIITAVLTVGCNIFGLLTRYHGYTYPLKDGSYSGTLQLIAIITFALVSVVFLIVTAAGKNEAAKQARIEA